MIKYSTGTFGLLFVLQCKGSVFPKGLVMAVPNAVLAMLMHTYLQYDRDGLDLLNMNGVSFLWAGYTSVLGFLIVFRNSQAYTRFWEGATLIHQVRGEWFNAVSSLFAFCNRAEERKPEVKAFQHTLIRLVSMLYCSALQQICDLDDDCFEIIETQGMEADSLAFMRECNDSCEVLLQWIQRLIMDSSEGNVLKVPPPLLTRAFQELSRGIVNLNNVRKIKEIPFPFPYAQLIAVMLIVHWVTTPIVASQLIESQAAAGVGCFCLTFAVWSLIFITMEIDQPFGDDTNDLPLHEMQRDFNHSLLTLMHPLAQRVPRCDYETEAQGSSGHRSRHDSVLKPSLTKTLDFIESSFSGPDMFDGDNFEAAISSCSQSAPSLHLHKSHDSSRSSRSRNRPSGRSGGSSIAERFGIRLRPSSGSSGRHPSGRDSRSSRSSIASLLGLRVAAETSPPAADPWLSRSSQVSRFSQVSIGPLSPATVPAGRPPDTEPQPSGQESCGRDNTDFTGSLDGQNVDDEGSVQVPTAPQPGRGPTSISTTI
mmetsp:Transcript_44207/g.89294  ORF Transcript_44207/g.89294 Transcript_44207/m.89294 type:complete len:537 (+) Transcript_44207:112-1722(+)